MNALREPDSEASRRIPWHRSASPEALANRPSISATIASPTRL